MYSPAQANPRPREPAGPEQSASETKVHQSCRLLGGGLRRLQAIFCPFCSASWPLDVAFPLPGKHVRMVSCVQQVIQRVRTLLKL